MVTGRGPLEVKVGSEFACGVGHEVGDVLSEGLGSLLALGFASGRMEVNGWGLGIAVRGAWGVDSALFVAFAPRADHGLPNAGAGVARVPLAAGDVVIYKVLT